MNVRIVASALFLVSLQTAVGLAGAQEPLGKIELTVLEIARISDIRLAMFVEKEGIDFDVTDEYLKGIQTAGAEPELLDTLRNAKPRRANAQVEETAGPRIKSASLEEEIVHHLVQGAQLQEDRNRLADAEQEYRAALQIAPGNPFLHFVLGKLLTRMGRGDDARLSFREAIRIKPDFAEAHVALGRELADLDQSIPEYREAVRIEPDNYSAHLALWRALDEKGDKKEAEEQYRIANELPASGGIPRRIRVGGEVMKAKLRSAPKLKYPKKAKKAGLQGTVRLDVVIGKDGSIKDIKVLAGDPELAQAAVEAVSRWKYRPTLLNGAPVEVVSEVDVNFSLSP